MEAMLTGGGADTSTQGQSVDQYIASRLPADTPFPSLELGVETDAWGGGVQTRMLYAPGHTFVSPDQDPVSVYKRLFGAADATPAQVDAALRKKLSVLDVLRHELAGLQQPRRHRRAPEARRAPRCAAAHGERPDRSDVDLGLRAPAAPKQVDPNAHENFAAITKSQIDLLGHRARLRHDARGHVATVAHRRAARVLVARPERGPPHALAFG